MVALIDNINTFVFFVSAQNAKVLESCSGSVIQQYGYWFAILLCDSLHVCKAWMLDRWRAANISVGTTGSPHLFIG